MNTIMNVLKLVAAVAVCFVPAAIGSFFPPGAWYESLAKPAYHPPDWLFGPVWTVLYAMQGVALFLVWRQGWSRRSVRLAIIVFFVQLALNALWTPVFFGAQWIGGAAVVIVVLWLAILVTIERFRRVSVAAALLLVPYMLWVSFAAVLNFHLWALNA
jgi:translocator protein